MVAFIDDVTIYVSTYGDDGWMRMARRVAIPSAESFGVPVIHVHGESLHGARNAALEQVTTGWAIALDADDRLDPSYLLRLDEARTAHPTAQVLVPSVRYIRPNGSPIHARMPRVFGHEHQCEASCLAYGNWIVIGAAVNTELARNVGGFHDHPWSEDWCLWVRCWQAGAEIVPVPEAIYIAKQRPQSRNRSGTAAQRLEYHREISRELGLPVP